MRSIPRIFRAIALSTTLAIALPTVALAGQNDRAQQAIAEARGRISAGNMVGAGDEAIGLQTRAKSTLNEAEALLSKGKKTEAIAAAQQAGQLADQAISMTNNRKSMATNAAVGNAEASAAMAQRSAADSASQAAAANARADMAMQAPVPAPAPAPTSVTTTVATQDTTIAKPAVVHTAPRTVRTTTVKAHSTGGHAHARIKKAPAKPAAKSATTHSTTVTTTSH
ncbi:MAG: hypothetical protein H7268_03830 [Sandarakinorhabdus sp.]|nr:hypothetical protein [Sandarakinorhabdus sp.]